MFLICGYTSVAAICFVQQTAKHFKGWMNSRVKATSAGLVDLQWTPDFDRQKRIARLNLLTQADKFWKIFEIQLQKLLAEGGATVQTILCEIARNSWFADCKWLQDEAIVKALVQQALKKLGDSAQYDDSLRSVVNALEGRGEYCCLDIVVPGEHVSNLMLSDEMYRNYALFDDDDYGCTILHLIGLLVIFSGVVSALGAERIRDIRAVTPMPLRNPIVKFCVAKCGLAVPDFGQRMGG